MRVFWITALLIFTAAGCRSKPDASAQQAQAAFFAGQQSVLQAQQQAANVTVRGPVKNQVIPWTDTLTLADAIVAADYYWPSQPQSIFIIRKGQSHKVHPRRLLSGQENPLLEPGDIVEMQR